MGILVCYDDLTYDVVSETNLDCMITSGCIVGFDSSREWVKMDDDPLPALIPGEQERLGKGMCA